jgi:large subunit ribosomal protein L5
MKTENVMKKIKIGKVVLSAGAVEAGLTKSKKLIELISGRKAKIIASTKRIPTFDVRPGLEVGVCATVRGKAALELLTRLLGAVDNKISKKSVADNHFSFGIEEYIEIPGMEYQRDIGVRGLNVTIDFVRAGMRVQKKKIKRSHVPKRQHVSKEEVIKFMEAQFKTAFA